MTFEDARPIVEGMLYAYGLQRRQPPAPAISSVYDQAAAPPPKPFPPRSSVETYVLRHEDELRLEAVMAQLGTAEREAIRFRYFERGRWEWVATQLHCSRAHAQRLVNRGLYAIAVGLGLLRTLDDAAA